MAIHQLALVNLAMLHVTNVLEQVLQLALHVKPKHICQLTCVEQIVLHLSSRMMRITNVRHVFHRVKNVVLLVPQNVPNVALLYI